MINFDGRLYQKAESLFQPSNRLLKYGDGLFETIRVFDGNIPFLQEHWNRLTEGMAYLGYDPMPTFSKKILATEISKTIQKKGNHRVRLSIFRKDGGKYLPLNNDFHYLIEVTPLKHNHFPISSGLGAGFCQNIPLSPFPLSQYKTSNSLPYIIAANQTKTKGFEEGIILSKEGNVVEACSSNLFIYKDQQFVTPPLSSGCLAGTTRKILIHLLGEEMIVKSISREEILASQEIYLCNAIQGIKSIKTLGGNTFGESQYHRLIAIINRLVEKRSQII